MWPLKRKNVGYQDTLINKTYKISGTGWLCQFVDGRWIPLTKLTDDQLRECR